MMICPNCGRELDEALESCPECGASVTIDTAPEAEVEAEAASEAVEAEAPVTDGPVIVLEDAEGCDETAEASEAEPADEPEAAAEPAADAEAAAEETPAPKKKKGGAIAVVVLSLIIVVLLGVIGCLVYQTTTGKSVTSLIKHERKLKTDAVAVELKDADGNVLEELSNADFAFYYWGEYYYYINYYGFTFDVATPLSEQVYSEADSAAGTEAMTWDDYFKQSALASYNQTQALIKAAEAEGFLMSEEYHTTYQSIIDSLPEDAISAGFTDADGNANVLGYIQESYGTSATLESFEQYIYNSYYAAAYSDALYNSFSYSEDALSAYYDTNADEYASYGLEKSDVPNINVRHILITPEADETDADGNTSASEDSKAAAQTQAESILQEWADGDATEDSFAALAETYSTDTGSSTNGGLYEDVYPGQMVTAFNDWCFDADRQPGDTGIVETEYGYHIMYFVATTDSYYWQTVVESDLRYEDYANASDALMNSYVATLTEKADTRVPDAVTALAEQQG